MIYILSI